MKEAREAIKRAEGQFYASFTRQRAKCTSPEIRKKAFTTIADALAECAAERKCDDRIEILRLPLHRGWGVNMTATARIAHARTIPSCLGSSDWRRWTGGGTQNGRVA